MNSLTDKVMKKHNLKDMKKAELVSVFLENFRLGAFLAGCVARRLQAEVSLQHKNGDSDESSALTAVDLAAQDVILSLLYAGLPEIAVDAEEDTPLVGLFAAEDGRPLIIIDPIDGTLNYYRKSEDYAVMAALCIDGRYEAAAVYFPAVGALYWTDGGQCLYRRNGGSGQACKIEENDRTVLVSPFVPDRLCQQLEKGGFSTILSRCSAVDALAPVLGRATAAVSCRIDRRSAVGWPITLAAGGGLVVDNGFWHGEDPADRYEKQALVVVAGSPQEAERIGRLLGAT
mgnify:CR=1 FL=1